MRGVLFAAAMLLLPQQAQADGVIDTQEEYAAAAAMVQGLYNDGNWAEAAVQLGAFADLAEGFFGAGHPEPLHYRSLQVFALERLLRREDVLEVAARALEAADAAGPAVPEALPMRIDLAGSLGRALYSTGQTARALAAAEAAIAQAEAVFGAEAPATVILRLDRARAAAALGGAGHLAQAAADFAFVAGVTGASADPGAQGYAATALREGAGVLRRQGDPRQAATMLAGAVVILERLHGPDAVETLTAMAEQVDMMTEAAQGDLLRLVDAMGLATEVHARAERSLGAGSAIGAETLAQRGWITLLQGGGVLGEPGLWLGTEMIWLGLQEMERLLPADDPRLARWRVTLLSVLNRADRLPADWALRAVEVAQAAVRQKSAGLAPMAHALHLAEAAGAMTPDAAAEVALTAVQELQFGMAPAVMGFWQKRLEQGTGAAQDLHRAFTDVTLANRALKQELLALLSMPQASRDASAVAGAEGRLAASRAEGDRIAAELAAFDPTFGANFAGVTLGLADLRALLDPDEAAVVLALPDLRVSDAAGIIVAVSRDAIAWAPLDRPPGEYLESVSALREAVRLQLGVRAAISLSQDQAAEPLRVTFRPDLAQRLYADTLGKVAAVTAGKAHLYLDLRGAMAMLPPHLLIVSPVAGDDLSDADWLIRHHALTVIPSLASLRTVALAKGQGMAPETYLAFGDADYAAAADTDPALETLRGGLAPLPETADEVRAVARSLGAGAGALRLAGDASEAGLKSADPGRYRILHFATHGLLSGDGAGDAVLGEPALALTPGQGEDGFLRASEILDLRLNADLVVLSACNTALGGSGDDEALSGLAMAFLYAGSRALLVSHWPVESRSAAHLMTETFRLRGADPALRTPEAQRRVMLAMIDSPTDPRWSHPAYWAPFVLVGSAD